MKECMYFFSPILDIFFQRNKIQTSTVCFSYHFHCRWKRCQELGSQVMRMLTPLLLRVSHRSHAESAVLCCVCWPAPWKWDATTLQPGLTKKAINSGILVSVTIPTHRLEPKLPHHPYAGLSRGMTQAQVGKIQRSKLVQLKTCCYR